MPLPTIPYQSDNEFQREKAVKFLDANFTKIRKKDFSAGLAIGNAMAYWSMGVITYYEYDFYCNAVYGAVYGKKF